MKITTFLLACFMALSIGAVGGYYTKGRFVKADRVDKIADVRKEDASNAAHAQATSIALADDIHAVRGSIADLKKESVRYVTRRVEVPQACAPTGAPESPDGHRAPRVLAADDALPIGLVRLLNAARGGAADRPAIGSDAEGQAPSDVAVQDFIDNDFDIVAEYHGLAKRHDALVEFVAGIQRNQRARLGISQP